MSPSQRQSTPANLSSPLPANTCASSSSSERIRCTPKRSAPASALWQRDSCETDTSSDGGLALNEVTDVAARPHGCPSARRAVTTATPEASEAIASWKSSWRSGGGSLRARNLPASRPPLGQRRFLAAQHEVAVVELGVGVRVVRALVGAAAFLAREGRAGHEAPQRERIVGELAQTVRR